MANGKPGAPAGNQNAKKAKRVRDEYIAILNADPSLLHQMCMAQVRKAIDEADTRAFDSIRDSIDGKPAQSVAIDGDGEGGPIKTLSEVLLRAVDATYDRPAPQDT